MRVIATRHVAMGAVVPATADDLSETVSTDGLPPERVLEAGIQIEP